MTRKQQIIIVWVTGLILFVSHRVVAQERKILNIDSCYAMAERNFPLIKQYGLIEQSKKYSIENANKGYLPQVGISGQATHQSDVTQIPISLPNMDIPTISKDQYRLYGEVSQPITDLFTVKDQKEYVNISSAIETQKVEVELFKLKERINQLYFGILLIDERLQQSELLKKDIESGIDQTNVAVANGVATKSSLNNLNAELLKVEQQKVELKANRKGFADMLSYFIARPIDENTLLEKPLPKAGSNAINRPELKLYDLQKKSFDIQNDLVTAKNLPRLSVFVQGGVGRPALNMLNPEMQGYYIAGVRLAWNISGLYTYKNERRNLSLNQGMVDLQKETFLFNTHLNLRQQHSEIEKHRELVKTDADIIALRESVKNVSKVQLLNGITTTNDYLTSVNAEDQARQNLILHQIQLLMAQYNYQTTSGN